MTEAPFKCCGCGTVAEDGLKPCNCATGVGFRIEPDGRFKHIVFRDPKSFDAAIHVPGLWRCAKCNFVLIQSNLNAADGSVTARDEAGDRCPNDNKPLWRVSWKEHATEMAQRAETEICRSRKLEKVLGRIAGGEYDYLKDAMNSARDVLRHDVGRAL